MPHKRKPGTYHVITWDMFDAGIVTKTLSSIDIEICNASWSFGSCGNQEDEFKNIVNDVISDLERLAGGSCEQ